MMFSLVIPVAPYRDAKILNSIKEMDYPKKEFEVIIEKGTNPSRNRNIGVGKAKGKLVVFLDDDAKVEGDYLKQVEKFFAKHPEVDIVGGPQLTHGDENFFGRISGIVLTSNFGVSKIRRRYIQGKVNCDVDETFLSSANLCVKKKTFEKIGGFNETLWPGEDPEFIFRAKKSGAKVAYNPEIVIYHKRRENFSSFCKQVFKYGFVRPKKDKISGKTNLVFLIPMCFSLYFIFLPTLFLINYFFLAPMGMYIFLAVVSSFYDSIRSKSLFSFFILPFLYFFTHLSYGFGMLAGYFDRGKLK